MNNKTLVVIEPKQKVKVIRELDSNISGNAGVVGMTMFYGYKIGRRGPDKTLVKVTDRDNVVKVLTFNTSQVVVI